MGSLWTKSGTVEFDLNGDLAPGSIANFFQGGTTTPLTVYEDGGETTPHETDVEADGNGRWPAVFVPFITSFDVRVTTAAGVQLFYFTDIANADPIEASEDSVDDTQLLQTGDWLFTPKGGTRSGFVRANGRTIGSASSGATERANADTEDLYLFTWNNFSDAICPVSGGRGGSAAADFAANKPIQLHDCRMGLPYGVDDMGNSAASRAASISFTNGNSTTGGSHLGANTQAIVTGNLPSHNHSVSLSTSSDGSHTHSGTVDAIGDHTHTGTAADHLHGAGNKRTAGTISGAPAQNIWYDTDPTGETNTGGATGAISLTVNAGGGHAHGFTTGSSGSHSHTVTGNTGSTGSGTALNIVSYGVSGTYYIKL